MIIKLDKYIKQFKLDSRPLYLINNISVIKIDLLTVLFKYKLSNKYKSIIQNYVDQLKKLEVEISTVTNLKLFNDFLESLSKKIIYPKIHPLVSNTFWDKLYFISTKISKYVIDLKYLHVDNETIDKQKDKPSDDKLKYIALLIENYKKKCIQKNLNTKSTKTLN